MKKAIKIVALVIIFMFMLTGCRESSTNQEDTIKKTEDTMNESNGSNEDKNSNNTSNVTDATDKKSVELIISAAASMQNSLEEIKQIYEKANKEIKLTFNFGSSGALEQQIEQGAPADIFMSAATKQMTSLKDGGYMMEDSITDLLQNKVVLIVPKNSTLDIKDFDTILKAKTIALGDPESVPAGQYAEEIFKNLGILDKVKEKASFGKDVTEVLTWISSGNAEAGVVYKTDALSKDNVKIVDEASEKECSKVIYPIGVVRASKEQDAAKAFVKYLDSDEAMAVFERYGFMKNK